MRMETHKYSAVNLLQSFVLGMNWDVPISAFLTAYAKMEKRKREYRS